MKWWLFWMQRTRFWPGLGSNYDFCASMGWIIEISRNWEDVSTKFEVGTRKSMFEYDVLNWVLFVELANIFDFRIEWNNYEMSAWPILESITLAISATILLLCRNCDFGGGIVHFAFENVRAFEKSKKNNKNRCNGVWLIAIPCYFDFGLYEKNHVFREDILRIVGNHW